MHPAIDGLSSAVCMQGTSPGMLRFQGTSPLKTGRFGSEKRTHSGQAQSVMRVFQVWRMRSLHRSSICMAPVGHTSAQAPQPMHVSDCNSKGVPTLRFVPRLVKPMAAAPIRSRHMRTQMPHKLHSSSACSDGGMLNLEAEAPSFSVILRIASDRGQRLMRNFRARRRA